MRRRFSGHLPTSRYNLLLNERSARQCCFTEPAFKGRRNIHDVTIQAYPRPNGVVANCWSCAIALVKVMRIPCFGCRMTLGRASIVWPGAS